MRGRGHRGFAPKAAPGCSSWCERLPRLAIRAFSHGVKARLLAGLRESNWAIVAREFHAVWPPVLGRGMLPRSRA